MSRPRLPRPLLHELHYSLLANYAGEAATLSRLNRIVLQHQNRDPDCYCVQVVGEEVKVLPKSAVPEEERFPKVEHKTIVYQPTDRTLFCPARGATAPSELRGPAAVPRRHVRDGAGGERLPVR